MEKVIEVTNAGTYEGDIYGTFYDTLFRLDADLPAHIPPFGSGDSALNLRYTSGRKHVEKNDQVTLELGLAYRRYLVACMGVVLTGPDIGPRHLKMHSNIFSLSRKIIINSAIGFIDANAKDKKGVIKYIR